MPEPRSTTQQKLAVKERAGNICEYCRSPASYSTQPYAVEHIIPLSRGGKTNLSNLAWSCQGCNGHKFTATQGYDRSTKQIADLFHPRRQEWSEHFTWNEDFTFVLGLTPTGRATVETLELNREGCVNLRQLLYLCGKHPLRP